MTRLYNPDLHDPLLTEMNEKWKRTDQEIGDALGFDKQLITRHRIRIGLTANYRIKINRLPAVPQEPKPPKARDNPLQIARMWLGQRLVEKPGAGYFIDGTPVSLGKMMQETYRVMMKSGVQPEIANPSWRPK